LGEIAHLEQGFKVERGIRRNFMDNWGTAAVRSSSAFGDVEALLNNFNSLNPIQKMEILYSIIRRNDVNALINIMKVDTRTRLLVTILSITLLLIHLLI
jgi:hypothetical protein